SAQGTGGGGGAAGGGAGGALSAPPRRPRAGSPPRGGGGGAGGGGGGGGTLSILSALRIPLTPNPLPASGEREQTASAANVAGADGQGSRRSSKSSNKPDTARPTAIHSADGIMPFRG